MLLPHLYPLPSLTYIPDFVIINLALHIRICISLLFINDRLREMETRNILIIEDNIDIADIYGKFFKLFYENIKVDHVMGGLKALEKALAEDYDLIICDIQIPEINGIEFFKRLKREAPHHVCKVLFITAGIEKYKNSFLEKQECPYIAKPFTKDIFIEKVNSILNSTV